jgi:hypothetical protein
LKNKKKKKGIRKKSERQKLIEACEKILREELLQECDYKCQFCGSVNNLGLFHVLPKSRYQRIRLAKDNLLIACWMPCHFNFHHDPFYAKDIIFPKIKRILGRNFEERLKILNETSEKLTLTRLKEIYKTMVS